MPPAAPRLSFVRKGMAALALIALADVLFFDSWVGATLGMFVLAWVAALALAVPALRRPGSGIALAVAAALALVMVDDPSLLAWVLCWTAIATAALLPRHRFDDAARWATRLAAHALIGLGRPIADVRRLARRRVGGDLRRAAALLALPVAGALVFGGLFALANPLIGNMLDQLSPPGIDRIAQHGIFCALALLTLWPSFRPRTIRTDARLSRERPAVDLPVATLTLSLVTFNALFAAQNALDIAFLWSGAPLPAGVTLADYAHRGAYTLIVTALLAGAFVLVALAPGSAAARRRTIRRLVVLWVAQNVLLVASSVLRLLDYIAAYSLTEWRIAALAWMALVAVGLVLVAVRLVTGRSAGWLVNANALAAGIVLLAACAVDLGAVAAHWNVDHARRAEQLDLCYLHRLGPSALLPLIDLERRAAGPALRDRARYLRVGILADLRARQDDWHGWTWRGARRLAVARVIVGTARPRLRPAPGGRACDGTIQPPPPPPTPLTAAPRP